MSAKQIDAALYASRPSKKYEEVELTPEQARKWTETRTALMWGCPAFSHILYTMMTGANGKMALFTSEVPIAATDGVALLLNPEEFFKLSLQERIFVVAHEIAHCMFDHCGQGWALHLRSKVPYQDGTELPYSPEIMNIAQDLVINDLLIESKVGKFNTNWLHDKSMATYSDSAIDVYRKLFKAGGGGGKKGNPVKVVTTGQRFDDHLQPGTSKGKDPNEAAGDRNAQEWKVAIAAARDSAKAQGMLPAAMERLFNDMLEPAISWQDKIHSFFTRKVGGSAYDFRKPDRRFVPRQIYIPSRSGHGAGDIVVAVDTSGSIGQPELDRFMAEVRGILTDLKPKRVFVLWIDAKLHKVDEVEDPGDISSLKPHGGGGTDFNPAFKWVDDNFIKPDALVYFTDLYGPWPAKAPGYPVLWARTDPRVTPDWGDVVDVPIKG